MSAVTHAQGPDATGPDPVAPSPFTARAGAVGHPVPEHYGEPAQEQRRLERGTAIVDLSHRGVVAVTGADRLTYLDSLTTQRLVGLAPGESVETLQLSAHGHVEFVLRLVDDGETAWLLVDDAAPVAAFYDRMRFRMKVTVVDRTADFATIGALGDVALPVAVANDVPLVWQDPWATPTGVSYAAVDEHPGAEWTYRETLVPRAELAALAASDAPAAGTLALDALRVAAWRPAVADLDERTLPHELDWLRSAVHLAKGCYRGQETVAKVHNLGHPPRRLVQLHLDGSEGVQPEPGDAVLDGETEVGRVTSVVRHHELGPVALAVVKRRTDAVADLVVRTADGTAVAAAQQVVVAPDAGKAVTVPRIPRLGARGR